MFKLKNVAVAAVLTISAVGAMASNFRAADQVYLPIGGHAVGGSGLFVSDLFISNLETDSVTVSMIYSTGTGGTQTKNLTPIVLQSLERRELTDFFGSLGISGLGQAGTAPRLARAAIRARERAPTFARSACRAASSRFPTQAPRSPPRTRPART